MKLIALIALLFSSMAMAETFKLPAGTTYRAKGVGYDCGEFITDYKPSPEVYASKQINFLQFSADKDLNTFLIEATFPTASGVECIYGAFFNRSRDTKTLDLDHSEIVTTADPASCEETKNYLDKNFASAKYYASKRGIRFIAVEILDAPNNVCENGIVRTVFDRR